MKRPVEAETQKLKKMMGNEELLRRVIGTAIGEYRHLESQRFASMPPTVKRIQFKDPASLKTAQPEKATF